MTIKPNEEHKLRITKHPKITEVYWCNLPETPYPNEFGYGKRKRPVIIFSKQNRLYGTALVIPLSTSEQTRPEVAVKMKSPLDGQDTWAVCSHIMPVSTYRLYPDRDKGICRVPHDVFQEIRERVFKNLPDQK